MSTCLGVTKTVAVSGLGLYAGILAATTVTASSKAVTSLIASLDVVQWSRIGALVDRVSLCANSLGAVTALFFATSYWGAPRYWRHPYLLYGMCSAPLASLYLHFVKRSATEGMARGARATTAVADAGNKPIQLDTDDEFLVDLGELPDLAVPTTTPVTRHLLVATLVAVVGLAQSVVGVYGEGQF